MFHIAVCDDEEYFRKREQRLIAKYMERKGYQCEIETFKSGLGLLKCEGGLSRFDVIFLDINIDRCQGSCQ